MPRTGITVYLPRDIEERIQRMAKEENRSESSVIGEAVKAKFDARVQDMATLQLRHGARMEARFDKAIGELLILKEVVLLFIRVWLEHNPPIDPSLEESAAASAEARFERFLDFVAQGLAPGKSIATRELVTPALSQSDQTAEAQT